METVLKTIAKQANLDRILFTPALKNLYFKLAVGSGGATQFKHADGVRKGLNYAAENAADQKQVLLFCAVHELAHAYDLLLRYANEMTPVMVLAVRADESGSRPWKHWSLLDMGGTGWMQFHTHTLQELYDHLAIAYNLYAEKEIKIPALVIHTAYDHASAGDYNPKEELNLGSPAADWKGGGKKKMDFDAALKAMKEKKEKPTLQKLYRTLTDPLRDIYQSLGYTLPETGLPWAGKASADDTAAITCIPAEQETDGLYRLLCYRPMAPSALLQILSTKKQVFVIEPQPTPGVGVPPFFGAWKSRLPAGADTMVHSVCVEQDTGMLSAGRVEQIDRFRGDAEILAANESQFLSI
ncbi:hypothetical protein GF373_15990 [bacterium]|nr:hypothetical protein [bacterium]